MGQYMSTGRQTSTPTSSSAIRIPNSPSGVSSDSVSLLLPLAEEYFEAAHKLAPLISTSMAPDNVDTYQRLIATGLGCLDAALRKGKLTPRIEATVRLRYSGVLHEETENTMEAETALAKGIVLCERSHFFDLKYAMQYLLAQIMGQKNLRAAMKALDGYISEAEAPVDGNAAVQNLQKVAELAIRQHDRAVHLTASVMEAMVHLRSIGPDSNEAVQRAIAAARTHQLTVGDSIPQLAGLINLIDVMCVIRSGNTHQMLDKLKGMQVVMDRMLKDAKWSSSISLETRSVVGIDTDGREVLIMSFLNKKDAFSIRHATDPKAVRYLKEGMEGLAEKSRDPKDFLDFMYLTGVWLQGIGNLDSALRIFQDPKLALPPSNPSTSTSVSQISRDFAILAALNTLWITQEPSRLNPERNNALLAQLTPLCAQNQNKDLHTAFCLIKATITTTPPTPLFEVKRHLSQALAGAQKTMNSQFLCITLNVMRTGGEERVGG
ncbi:putative MAU2 chromatid cohesion factor like protein [Glarea lozoyensis 74030]|uniref:Putative MAU2 chromatid cohesion factor like protein n=1 Tax=Glarea lozoyensis (strain ATCC 74030 / MF5533) TaxID=1104152 RepID=H0EIC0_GLAL7|nr:putative MAU2 chromatid cohesion factor like protein [Glarea lozoyensis 74030]